MTEVRLHRLALCEFHAARRWYRKRSLLAEDRFIHAIARTIQKIERMPTLAPADDDSIHWVATHRYP